MQNILVVNKRVEFISDLNLNIEISEDDMENISINTIVYKDNKEFQEVLNKNNFDCVILSDNVMEDPEFVIPVNVKIMGILDKRNADDSIFTKQGIVCAGYFRKPSSLVDYIRDNLNLDNISAVNTSANTQLSQSETVIDQKSANNQNTFNHNDSSVNQSLPRNNNINNQDSTSHPKFCENCGVKLLTTSKFCPECGAPLLVHNDSPKQNETQKPMSTPVSGPIPVPIHEPTSVQARPANNIIDSIDNYPTESEPQKHVKNDGTSQSTVTPQSSVSQKKFCGYCGATLTEANKFCPACGKPVQSTESFGGADEARTVSEMIKEKANERINDQEHIDALVAEDTAQHKHSCKIVTVYSAKGGVGKTTIASELAVYMARTCTNRRRSRVCIVDYNIDFGNVLSTLDFKNKGANMIDWTSDINAKIDEITDSNPEKEFSNEELISRIHYTKEEIESYLQLKSFGDGVDVYGLIAPIVHTDSMLVDEISLYVMLKNLKENGDFDYIICDTGNNTRDSSYIALEKADFIFMICTQDVTTANCNDSFVSTMDALGFDKSRISLIINQIVPAKETGISVTDIENYVPFPCVARIRRNTDVIAANNKSQPLALMSNHQFTKELTGLVSLISDEGLTVTDKKKKWSLFKKS